MSDAHLSLLRRITGWYWLALTQVLYRSALGSLGRGSRIVCPLQLRNLKHVDIGARVTINRYAWIMTIHLPDRVAPRLIIGDGSVIGHFNHFTCVNRVSIGSKVLTADRVHISDNIHGFENPELPIMEQKVFSKGPVEIGDGCWLGENVSVLSCRVGRNCVIGANAVVTRDIPDFSVAVGVPARVIRRFNLVTRRWESVD